MKKFTIPCVFGEKRHPFDVYIDNHPTPGCHPLKYQARWLEVERNGQIPAEVMDSFQKLWELAKKHRVDFAELCVHAMRAVNAPSKPEPPPPPAEPPPPATESEK